MTLIQRRRALMAAVARAQDGRWINDTIELIQDVDIIRRRAVTTDYPYYYSSPIRCSYIGLEITTSAQYKYKVVIHSNSNHPQVGVRRLTETQVNQVINAQNISPLDDSRWQDSGYEFMGFENGAVFLTLRKSDNSDVAGTTFSVTVTREVIT